MVCVMGGVGRRVEDRRGRGGRWLASRLRRRGAVVGGAWRPSPAQQDSDKDWGSWVRSSRTALIGAWGWWLERGVGKGGEFGRNQRRQTDGVRYGKTAMRSYLSSLGPTALGLYREIPPGIRGISGPRAAQPDLRRVLATRADLLSPEVHKQRHFNPHQRPE